MPCQFCQSREQKIYVRTYERGVEDETLACAPEWQRVFLHANRLNLLTTRPLSIQKSNEELTLSKHENTLFKGSVQNVFTTTLKSKN